MDDQLAVMTPAQVRGDQKRQRHADAVAAGEMTYADICAERRQEFKQRIAALPATDRALLNDWAERQAIQSGSPQAVAHHNVVGWPEAFMIGRWGEEVEHWPAALTDADKQRLDSIDRGGKPLKFIRPLKIALAQRRLGERFHADAMPGQLAKHREI